MAYHFREMIYSRNRKDLVNDVVRMCRDKDTKDNFDTIVVSGMSGLIMGSPVAIRLDKQLIIVRKESDDTHEREKLYCQIIPRRFIIIDDFISSGKTFRFICESMAEYFPDAENLGGLMYHYTCEREERNDYNGHTFSTQKIWVTAEDFMDKAAV